MTIRMRVLPLPGEQYVFVVDGVSVEEQEMFADAFARFTEHVRERTDGRCTGGLVFHDPVDLPAVDSEPLAPLWPFDMEPAKLEEPVICEQCRKAADSGNPDRPHCPVCSRQIEVYRTDLPEAEQTLYSHGDGEGGRCDGSKGPPVYRPVGHCSGNCGCQHRRKGAWRGRSA
jgi:hypothetical protein